VFTYENYKKAFEAVGLVPIDAQRVLDCLEVRLRTLLLVALLETCYEPYKHRQNKLTNARKVLSCLLTISITLTELCRNRSRDLISSLTRLGY
jgi:hypothetical protein